MSKILNDNFFNFNRELLEGEELLSNMFSMLNPNASDLVWCFNNDFKDLEEKYILDWNTLKLDTINTSGVIKVIWQIVGRVK